jgi:hypothetical protein
MFMILNFIHKNHCSGVSTLSSPDEIRTPPTKLPRTVEGTIDSLALENLAKMTPAKISDMVRNLQIWLEDMQHRSTDYGNERRHRKIQRFLCVGVVHCQELLYIDSSEISRNHGNAPALDNDDPYRRYLPVGFLKPLTFEQTEEMYLELNEDRGYRSSLYPVQLIENTADMARIKNNRVF